MALSQEMGVIDGRDSEIKSMGSDELKPSSAAFREAAPKFGIDHRENHKEHMGRPRFLWPRISRNKRYVGRTPSEIIGANSHSGGKHGDPVRRGGRAGYTMCVRNDVDIDVTHVDEKRSLIQMILIG